MPREDDGRTQTPSADDAAEKGSANGGKNRLIDRRSYLKAAGVTAAAAAGATGAASAADYDVVKVPAGGHKRYNLDDGQTFENVLFDCTASNTRVSIVATGQNWTIRNVGFKGVHDQDGGHAVLGLSAANGSDCLVENVYMGDGSSVYDGASGSETAAWVAPESTGTITFRQCYFANWKDNAVYASAPGGGGNGPVVIDRCFAANNNHADYRIGSSGSVVKDSVVLHDRNTATCRGIWCWYNTGLEVRNCHVDMNGHGAAIHAGPYEPGGVNVSDTQYDGALVEDGAGNGDITLVSGNGTDPQVAVPDGVPQSAEEAASGSSSDGGEEQSSFFEHTLRVDTDDGARLVDYEFVTSGEAVHGSEAEASDTVTENDDGTWTITGVVGNGYADSFEFNGELQDATLSNPAVVTVDGEERDLGPSLKTLTVDTEDGADTVDYEITTSGQPTHGPDAESGSDSITENADGTWTIQGVVANGYSDDFEFVGDVLDVSLSNPAVVYVDGQEVARKEATSEPTHTLTVDTDEYGEVVDYVIATSGELRAGPEAEPSDEISENADGTWTVEGVVGNGYADSFEFEGEVLDVSLTNPAVVYVDGEEIARKEPSSEPIHTLVVDTADGGEVIDYEFTTSGEATHGPKAESGSDNVTENADGTWTIEGVVGNGYADSFEFEGEILAANLTGPATVTVDGEELDVGGDASPERHTLAVETDPGADLVRYTIVTSGEATHGPKAEPSSDSITQNSDGTWTIEGVTGDGYADSFEFEGEVLDVSLSNPATVLVDGSEYSGA